MNLSEFLKTTEFTNEEIKYLVDSYKTQVETSKEEEARIEKGFKAVEALKSFNDLFGNDTVSIKIVGGENSLDDSLVKAKEKFKEFKKETIVITQIYEKLKRLTELID